MTDETEFEIYDGDDYFAGVSGQRERAWGEAMHYAMQCEQPRIQEVTRVPAPMGEEPPRIQSLSETQSALEMWKKAWREEDGFGAEVMGRLDKVTPRLKISGALYSPSGMLEALDALIARDEAVMLERDRLKEDLSAARQSLYEVAAQRNELHATLQKHSIDGVPQ